MNIDMKSVSFFPAPLLELEFPPPGSTVVVAMSGGVDSSLAALMMAERGCRVIGATMKVYDPSIRLPPGTGNSCFAPDEEEDEERCRRLCVEIGAEYQVVDLSKAYASVVLDNFRSEYRAGRTPNPCLRCNPSIKFGLLPQALRERGTRFDFFVTGHYARLLAPGGDTALGVYLAPAADPSKDQTYFLQRLSSETLRWVRFPLGGMVKTQVRALAAERGLEAAGKKDSQDFVASEDLAPLFADEPMQEGDIVDDAGRTLGRHRGIVRYTVGQRRGLGVSTGPEPLYVLSMDARMNRVVVGSEANLYSRVLEGSQAHWAPRFGEQPFRALAKIRLASAPAAALVSPLPEGRIRVDFDDGQRAIAPGQSVAFYIPVDSGSADLEAGSAVEKSRIPRGTVLAGCAVIDRAFP